MNRSLKYLFIFLFVSLVMGYVAYWSLVEAKIIEAFLMLGMWAFASFLVYGVYVGWIKTGASAVMQERYSNQISQTPLTRDDEILHQFTLFFNNIDSIVRDTDMEE